MSGSHDVVIIGAGVAGCSIALHLAKLGVRSQIIERESIAARASGKSWAVFAYPPRFLALEGQPPELLFSMPLGSVHPWLELMWLGYHRLPDMAVELREATGVDIGYGELAWIRLAYTEQQEDAYRASLALQQQQGYHEGYWMESGELRALFPGVNPLSRGGMALPYLQVEPYRYTLALGQAAERRGATIRQGEVVAFRKGGGKVRAAVLATGGEVEADAFILATGPWTSRASAALGREIRVLVNREQCIRMQPPAPLPPCGLVAPDGVTIISKVGGDVIVGHAGRADLQTEFDVSLTTEAVRMHLLGGATELLPGLAEGKLVEHRGDLEGWSPPPRRIQPVLGRLTECENAYVAARFGTLGMMMSPGTGQIMADLVAASGAASLRFRRLLEVLAPGREL